MWFKRLLITGALVGLSLALSLPRSGHDRIVFAVSGGGLTRHVSFDSDRIGPARGWWWKAEPRVPHLSGPQLRMRFYDSASPSEVTEWTYVPQESGALAVVADHLRPGIERTIWMAFTPAFNADFISQVDGSFDHVDSHTLLVLLALSVTVVMMMTAAGFRLYDAPLWLLRLVRRDAGVAAAGDAGPAYLYTSVPRELWVSMGRLGRVPTVAQARGRRLHGRSRSIV